MNFCQLWIWFKIFLFFFLKRNGIHKFWDLHSRKSFSLLYTFTGNQSSLYLWSQSPAEVRLDSWLHMAILQPAQYYQNKRTSSQLSICKEQVTLPLPSLYIHPHVFSCLLPHILWLDITPSLCFFIKKKTRWLFIKIKLFSTHVTRYPVIQYPWHYKHFFHLLWVKSKSYYNIFPKIFPHL